MAATSVTVKLTAPQFKVLEAALAAAEDKARFDFNEADEGSDRQAARKAHAEFKHLREVVFA